MSEERTPYELLMEAVDHLDSAVNAYDQAYEGRKPRWTGKDARAVERVLEGPLRGFLALSRRARVIGADTADGTEVRALHAEAEALAAGPVFVLRKSGDQFIFWLKAATGEILMTSERHTTRAGAKHHIEAIRRLAPDADVEDLTGE